MAETTIGNWFDKVFFDAHGEPCAGGTLYFYQTGTNIPCGVVTAGGVLLGACVRLDDDGRPVEDFRFYADRSYRVVLKDADGAVVKQIDDVCIAQTEGGGMYNPMTALGDLIVGGEDGVPSRLGVGTAGQVPTAQEDGSIAWEDTRGFGKVSAASGDASASYLDNKLDVTTPLAKEVTTGQHNIKRVKLSVSAGDTAGKVLTTTDNGLGVLVPTWQTPTGMENPMTAKADIIVGGASGAPDKLAAPANASFLRAYKNSSNEDVVNWSKLSAGSGVSITDAGSQVTIAATAQTGDHQLLVSSTDAAAGYLGAKLTAGSNITITPQTDGDGVQTLELSSTGGGGGGGATGILIPFGPMIPGWVEFSISASQTFCWFGRTALRNCKIKKILIGTFGADKIPTTNELGIYAMRSNRALTLLGKTSTCSIVGGGELMYEFTTPLSVGDEIIFIGHLASECYVGNRIAFIRSVGSSVTQSWTLPPSIGVATTFSSSNTGSRSGFVWSDRTITTLPASTTSSEWNYNYNYIPLPYTEVFYE